jgi:hypothetical protein
MKKLTLTMLTLIIAFSLCFSQDLITKKSGEDIQAKISEVNQTDIRYTKLDNPNGPTFTILKSDILLVRYANGTKDIFNEENNPEVTVSSVDLFRDGQTDADKYYRGYKGSGTGTLLSGLLVSPLLALIPAIACSSADPKDNNLDYPNSELMKKSEYYNGYTQKAKKIKQHKVWTNWGIALGVNVVAVLLLTSGQ